MFRVIQWATGAVGKQAARMVHAHPEMTLVGGYVTSESKVGRDLGELIGVDPIGVIATDDIDEICALDADCVIHAPLPAARVGDDPDLDTQTICRLLESGKNVITTVGYINPKVYGADVLGRIEAACAAGRSSLHGTGLHPGIIAEVIPLTLSPVNSHIDRIVVTEAEDWSAYPSPQIVFEMMNMAKYPDEFAERVTRTRRWMDGLFGEAIHLIADGLGARLDRIDSFLDTELAERAFDIAAGTVPRGTVAAQRFRWEGIVDGEARIVQECVYRAAPFVAPEWGPANGVDVRVEGRPGMHVHIGHEVFAKGLTATAAHAVHAVPAVVGAAPGVRTFLDLPLITARHSMGRRRG